MEEIYEYLKSAGTYYLATIDGNKPRVRPFGTVNIFEDKLYIQSAKNKAVAKQISINPQVEICAMKDGSWIRVEATLVDDNRIEAKESMLEAYPHLKKMYNAQDKNTQVLYLKDVKATIESFAAEKKIIEF